MGSESLEYFAKSNRQLHPGGAISMAGGDRVDVKFHNDKKKTKGICLPEL